MGEKLGETPAYHALLKNFFMCAILVRFPGMLCLLPCTAAHQCLLLPKNVKACLCACSALPENKEKNSYQWPAWLSLLLLSLYIPYENEKKKATENNGKKS